MRRQVMGAILLALGAALFFTLTYVLNRAMAQAGGHWMWTAALRYLLTLPLLALVLPFQGGLGQLPAELRNHAGIWILWSSIGFGAFCLCLTWAAAAGPSWLVAGTFQVTVIAGVLMAPFIYKDERRTVPVPMMLIGLVVLAGVWLMQAGHSPEPLDLIGWLAMLAVIVAAFAYPLGNRMIMLHLEHSGAELNATQRVFGMTLMSQPLWLALVVPAALTAGWPSLSQLLLSAGVALSAGVIATVLFFQATSMVRHDGGALAAVESMQAAELLFATALGMMVLAEAAPAGRALAGVGLIVLGIVGASIIIGRRSAGDPKQVAVLRTDRGA